MGFWLMSLGVARGQQFVGVFSGQDGGEVHGDVLDERRVNVVEREHHGQWVGLFDRLMFLFRPILLKIRELGRISLAEGCCDAACD